MPQRAGLLAFGLKAPVRVVEGAVIRGRAKIAVRLEGIGIAEGPGQQAGQPQFHLPVGQRGQVDRQVTVDQPGAGQQFAGAGQVAEGLVAVAREDLDQFPDHQLDLGVMFQRLAQHRQPPVKTRRRDRHIGHMGIHPARGQRRFQLFDIGPARGARRADDQHVDRGVVEGQPFIDPAQPVEDRALEGLVADIGIMGDCQRQGKGAQKDGGHQPQEAAQPQRPAEPAGLVRHRGLGAAVVGLPGGRAEAGRAGGCLCHASLPLQKLK